MPKIFFTWKRVSGTLWFSKFAKKNSYQLYIFTFEKFPKRKLWEQQKKKWDESYYKQFVVYFVKVY